MEVVLRSKSLFLTAGLSFSRWMADSPGRWLIIAHVGLPLLWHRDADAGLALCSPAWGFLLTWPESSPELQRWCFLTLTFLGVFIKVIHVYRGGMIHNERRYMKVRYKYVNTHTYTHTVVFPSVSFWSISADLFLFTGIKGVGDGAFC